MADDDVEQRPSLEPPKLFRRRDKAARPPAREIPSEAKPEVAAAPAEEPAETPPAAEVAEVEEVDSAVVAVEPEVEEPEVEQVVEAPEGNPAPVAVAEPEPEPEPEPELAATVAAPEPAATVAAAEPAEDRTDSTPADEPRFTDAATVPVSVGDDPDERAADPRPDDVPETTEEREPRGPLLVGRNAALVTGLLVGILLVLLAAGGSATCTAVRGTSACGVALGLPVIAVILTLATVAGALLLRVFRLPAPGSTSFMAVALLGVVTGLFLGDSLDSWAVRVAYPVGSALAFLAAWWLTVSFDDPEVVRQARQEREREVA